MLTIVRSDGLTIVVPEDFFTAHYEFGLERFKNIRRASGLRYDEFATRYGFGKDEVTRWGVHDTKREGNHAINNPHPSTRLKLAFIEQELHRQKNLKAA